jgi:hypothetical protein
MIAGSKLEPPRLSAVVDRVIWSAVRSHGESAIGRAVARMNAGSAKTAAASSLRHLRRDLPFRADASSQTDKASHPELETTELHRLEALDTLPDEPRRIPFRLLHEVLQFTPAEALELAGQLPKERTSGHWLAWMLFMRAAEGEATAAAGVAAETGIPLTRAGQATATVFALRPELDAGTAMAEIREMPSPDRQRQALSGFLTGRTAQEFITRELGNPAIGYASQIRLPADYWRAGLCRATAAGAGEAALRLAGNLQWESEPGRALLKEDIVTAWALADHPSLRRCAEKLSNPDEIQAFAAAFADALPFLPAAAHLDPDNPLPTNLLASVSEHHWKWLAFEAREAGFRFFERRAEEPAFTVPARQFAAGAVHYEPDRARALLLKAGPPAPTVTPPASGSQ